MSVDKQKDNERRSSGGGRRSSGGWRASFGFGALGGDEEKVKSKERRKSRLGDAIQKNSKV
jgi:hypothetical protein